MNDLQWLRTNDPVLFLTLEMRGVLNTPEVIALAKLLQTSQEVTIKKVS